METLNDTSWDVVISGTGLPQSLLALALSRSGKKVLHLDRNDYYGGDEAALSLDDARAWADRHAAEQPAATSFSHASVHEVQDSHAPRKLLSSRAYSLALAPHLLYTRSALLAALVSSKTDKQLEFQAVGSWFLLDPAAADAPLIRVPGGREDIFQDESLDLKAKRSLMKFLRFVTNYEEQQVWLDNRSKPFTVFLQENFALPPASHPPILALTLSTMPVEKTTVESAVPRIARHLSSIGLFGPGFGAVLPKWGGLAEIGQVVCRASAVGGGVYVLGRGLVDVQHDDEFNLRLQLSDGDKVTTKWLAGLPNELPGSLPSADAGVPTTIVSKKIVVVSSPLTALFPSTSEGGPTPAGAVVCLPSAHHHEPPVHVLAHSSESGECPTGQCILYASVTQGHDLGFPRLSHAVAGLLQSFDDAQVLWDMQYQQHYLAVESQRTGPVIAIPPIPPSLSLEDGILDDDVKVAWRHIIGADSQESFMSFEARGGTTDDDEQFE